MVPTESVNDPISELPDDAQLLKRLGSQQSNLLSLCEGQVPLGDRRRHKQWHAATMPKPARANWLRYAHGFSSLLARDPGGNLLPELTLHCLVQVEARRGPVPEVTAYRNPALASLPGGIR